MMVHYVLENFKYAGYREEEAPSILEQIEEIQNKDYLANLQIILTPEKFFKYCFISYLITTWLFINDKKDPVQICFLFQKQQQSIVIKSFLLKPTNQWKFIPKYENQNEPDLSAIYSPTDKLSAIIDRLRNEFKITYPYSSNSIVIQKDQAKVKLEKEIRKYTDKMEDDWRGVKELGNQLFKEYEQVQDQRAKLKQLKVYLSGLNEKLTDEIKCMNQFTADYSQQEVNEDNILQILSLNQVEDQICNLQANIHGIRDTYKYTQNRMKTSSNVTLEWVCQIVKQLAEQEFNDIQLLKKCNRFL